MKQIFTAALACAAAACAFALPAHADGFRWSGDVDNKADIVIRGHDVHIKADMKGVSNEHHEFHGWLRPGVNSVGLRSSHGRGRIRIVQQPNAQNGFTAVVHIKDSDPGQSHYDFSLQW